MTHDWHWTFGKTCHISFPNGGDPVVAGPHAFKSDEGCATWSDAFGQLSFYTDGQGLWNGSHAPVPSALLGGAQSSAHSAIIVPPAGGGSRFHIFAVRDWASGISNAGPITYTAVTASGSTVAIVSPPAPLSFGPKKASEKLAAIPHRDCDKYWVVSLDMLQGSPGASMLYSMLIESDAGPSLGKTFSFPYPLKATPAAAGYCMKFSPDGKRLAMSSISHVAILDFDRATGAFALHSEITDLSGMKGELAIYGIEFSPSSRYLFMSGINSGEVRRHQISNGSTTFAATDLIGTSTDIPHGSYRLGALQLGPNGKIYGAKVSGTTLLEIGDPDNASPAAVAFKLKATDSAGQVMTFPKESVTLGLPTFTRIADDCVGDRCERLAAEVDEKIVKRRHFNRLVTCAGEPVGEAGCRPLEIPAIRPWTSITWGDSRCDCIEGDDTEVMHLTVCNPYSNLTLSNLVVTQLVVVDDKGQPVPILPNGSPAIELVPIGPYCFDDIAPCSCVTREFVLRLRGAPGGRYRILVKGICFDACFHGDEDACFAFDVCPD